MKSLILTLLLIALPAHAVQPAYTVEVYPADSTQMEPGVLSFTDKGDGVVQLEALLCGKYLVFTYDTKLAPIQEFEAFINETVERVCGP